MVQVGPLRGGGVIDPICTGRGAHEFFFNATEACSGSTSSPVRGIRPPQRLSRRSNNRPQRKPTRKPANDVHGHRSSHPVRKRVGFLSRTNHFPHFKKLGSLPRFRKCSNSSVPRCPSADISPLGNLLSVKQARFKLTTWICMKDCYSSRMPLGGSISLFPLIIFASV